MTACLNWMDGQRGWQRAAVRGALHALPPAASSCSRTAASTRPRCRSPRSPTRDPEKTSVREALGRAYFRNRQFAEAAAEFEAVVERQPVNDLRALLPRPRAEPDRASASAPAITSRWPRTCGPTAATTGSTATGCEPRPERPRAPASMRALVQRVSRAEVRVDGASGSPGSAPGCWFCSASAPATARPRPTASPRRSRAAGLRRRGGPDERAARRARGALRQPVHPLRRHPQGQPPELRDGGAARAGRAALRAILHPLGALQGRFGARWRSSWSTTDR